MIDPKEQQKNRERHRAENNADIVAGLRRGQPAKPAGKVISLGEYRARRGTS